MKFAPNIVSRFYKIYNMIIKQWFTISEYIYIISMKAGFSKS